MMELLGERGGGARGEGGGRGKGSWQRALGKGSWEGARGTGSWGEGLEGQVVGGRG